MKKLSTIAKPLAARVAITLGMTLLWLDVMHYLLGYGFSSTIAAVVFGYGLTDRFIVAASHNLRTK